MTDFNASGTTTIPPDRTERKFLELLPHVTELGPRAELFTQIAACAGAAAFFDRAHRTLDDVERMLPQAGPIARVRYLLKRGRVFNSSGLREKAKALFVQAFEEAVDGVYLRRLGT